MEGEDSMNESLNKCPVGSKHPTFRKVECEALVELVEQHKAVLMSRQINGAALRAKDRVWAKIGRSFNSKGFPVQRSIEHLRVKWENLKKSTRKKTSHLQEACFSERDELTRRVLALMCQAHDSTAVPPDHVYLDIEGPGDISNMGECGSQWDDYLHQNGDSESSHQTGDDGDRVKYRRESRSMSFSGQACNVLLQCVRAEKKYIFSPCTTGKANRAKNHAWLRITQAFNKRMPSAQRTTKVLRTKFMNMKKRARAVMAAQGRGAAGGGEDEVVGQLFKKEKEDDTDEGMEEIEERVGGEPESDPGSREVETRAPPDPLSSVLGGYGHPESCRLHDDCSALNQEVVRLKIELLKYQLETAKMERERVAAAAEGEAAERARRAALLVLQISEMERERVAVAAEGEAAERARRAALLVLQISEMERARVVAAAEGEAAERARRAALLELQIREVRRGADPATSSPPAPPPPPGS